VFQAAEHLRKLDFVDMERIALAGTGKSAQDTEQRLFTFLETAMPAPKR
jgi:hypothetical protein